MAQVGRLTCVLDASALLALVRDEIGGNFVLNRLPGAVMSAVNLHEVLARLVDLGDEAGLSRTRGLTGTISVRPFDADTAERAAALREPTRSFGLSLGDRACLALAAELGLPILTTDRRMAEVDVGIDIRLVR